jgi:hypothetical protein
VNKGKSLKLLNVRTLEEGTCGSKQAVEEMELAGWSLLEDIVRMFLPALVKNYKPYSTLAEERKYHSWGEEALLEWL